jgi:hypothetical protein
VGAAGRSILDLARLGWAFPEAWVIVATIIAICVAVAIGPKPPGDLPGAGSALLEALASGWEPPANPPRPPPAKPRGR